MNIFIDAAAPLKLNYILWRLTQIIILVYMKKIKYCPSQKLHKKIIIKTQTMHSPQNTYFYRQAVGAPCCAVRAISVCPYSTALRYEQMCIKKVFFNFLLGWKKGTHNTHHTHRHLSYIASTIGCGINQFFSQ